jgi:excisionase family DNA binding protein
MNQNPLPDLLTIAEFCRNFSVSRATFYRLAEAGAFPLIKVGRATRIRRSDAEAWAASLPTRAA